MESKTIYRDESFEQITKQEIEIARQALETVITEWSKLKLGHIGSASEMHDLVFQSELMYDEAVKASARITNDVNIPHPERIRPNDPGAFFTAAKTASGISYVDRSYGIFTLSKGKVVLTEKADEYIYNRSIYVTNEDQERFFNDYMAFVKMFNKVNELKSGILTSVPRNRMAYSELLVPPPEGYNDYPCQPRYDLIRELLNRV